MNPQTIIFGIQATLRAAQAGVDLYGEHARDRKVFLPNLDLPEGTRETQVAEFLSENSSVVADEPALLAIWDIQHEELKTADKEKIDAAYEVILRLKAESQLAADGRDDEDAKHEAEMVSAGRMIEQWREDKKPPSAMARFALTLTDIGLEFVAANPSIFGASSKGEKLIAAFATNMSALIPNDVSEFGTKENFADRVLGIFLRAGLGALTENSSVVFKDEDLEKLVLGVAKPIVDALPTSIAEQFQYRKLVDTLAGPAAEAAFSILAANTETYLGNNFANDKALGAITSALFEEMKLTAQSGSIVDVFGENGVIRLYQAALSVAVDRPELFIGDDNSDKSKLFRDLLSGTANSLRAHPRFKGSLGVSLASMVVETVGKHAPALIKLNPNDPWENVAATTLDQIISSLSQALNDRDGDGTLKGAWKSFSDGQLLELGRIVLEQMAKTPGMIGVNNTEVQSIVAGIAEAMAADDNLLLSSDEWIQIAGIAAQKAAENPGRLFGLSTSNQSGAFAVSVLKQILTTAGESWKTAGRSGRPVLFGETLKTIIDATVEALAGNITALSNQPDILENFIRKLLEKASLDPQKFGSESMIMVYKSFLARVLAIGSLPSDSEIIKILNDQNP